MKQQHKSIQVFEYGYLSLWGKYVLVKMKRAALKMEDI